MTKHIGILIAGGDSPGSNAAIRGVCKTAHSRYGLGIIGFRDGFRGLMENCFMRIDSDDVFGVLAVGGAMPGHMQRGGTTSASDRLIASTLGSACADMIYKGAFWVMVALHGNRPVPVPLDEVAGRRRVIPQDHPWIDTARQLGFCLGDGSRRPA